MKNNYKSQIKKSLSKLGIEPQEVLSDTYRSENLNNIDKKYDIFIPNEFKEFLLIYNEVFFDNEVRFKPIESSPWTTTEGTQYFEGFYGLSGQDNISEQIECYENQIPNCLIPIGECPAGNLICLGVKEDTFGKIYFWDHENELQAKLMVGKDIVTNDINLYWDNLYLVSESFLDFLNKLEICQNTSVDQKIDVDDVELFLDDDLLDD
ncbi:SMI1/KNR4 family protein [Rossellomorea sp. BNER]|uniref:SMI1/KNR4 family protein n=1 Tax=Rossellomorea sp. BNER TaxID=2962031 RepID=UPI003AF2368E|nr:SMI1/KNR4 family protein [Rossellomorea sp. BNER]